MTELEKERRAFVDLQVSRSTAECLQNENASLRGELREVVAQMQAVKDENIRLADENRTLTLKEHGWPWALEQLAAGHKVTHPILQGSSMMPGEVGGWIEKIGEGPRGTLDESHDTYCYSRVLDSENGWRDLANKARQSIGWTVCK